MSQERVILGIDPGTRLIGWGVIKVEANKPIYQSMGVISLGKDRDHFTRLSTIFEEVTYLIKKFKPTEFAIESPFYGKNVQSMLKLGRAQGIAIAAALAANLKISEYAPRKIKQSITGRGAASKDQVASVICSILSVKELPLSFDATDGLAAALCHFISGSLPLEVKQSEKNRTKGGSGKSWDTFVKNNPQRVK